MSQAELRWGRIAQLFGAIAIAGFSPSVNGQDVRALSEEIHQFHSPMVLEMSLDPLLKKPVGDTWSTDRTKVFVCRGVAIESLEFRVQPQVGNPPSPTRRSAIWHEKRIQIRVFLNNNSGKDKFISIRFEGMDGERSFCSASIEGRLEQGDTNKYRVELVDEPSDRWTQEPRPRLRVVLTLRDY